MSYAVHTRFHRLLLAGCAALLVGLLGGVADARAADGGCESQVIENPFTPWEDAANYTLVRDGDLDEGGAAWDLEGAEVVEDNEPWNVHGSATVAAMRLRDGESATTPPICITPDHPTMRFFVKSAGEGSLEIEAVLRNGLSVPLGPLLGTAHEWQPSPILPILVNLIADEVSFRFSASGEGAEFVVDDVYVDPYGKG